MGLGYPDKIIDSAQTASARLQEASGRTAERLAGEQAAAVIAILILVTCGTWTNDESCNLYCDVFDVCHIKHGHRIAKNK